MITEPALEGFRDLAARFAADEMVAYAGLSSMRRTSSSSRLPASC